MLHARAYLGHVNCNRFLLLDVRGEPPIATERFCRLGVALCQSPFVDDFIIIDSSTQASLRMRVFGGDGREADFCGNGSLFALNCVAKEFFPHGRDHVLTLETASGINAVRFGRHGFHQVAVGPVEAIALERGRLPASYKGLRVRGLVRAGEPHLVVEAPESLRAQEGGCTRAFEQLASQLADEISLPGGVNVTMLWVRRGCSLSIRTYERGVRRMTASCGSAAIAAVSCARFATLPASPITVISPGGVHQVYRGESRAHWWLSGRGQLLGSSVLSDFIDLARVEREGV